MKKMKKKKTFQPKNMTKKELEKFYKIKLSEAEFEVIKSMAIREYAESIDYNIRFAPFRDCIFAVSRFSDGTKRSKFNFNRSNEKEYNYNTGLRGGIYGDIENNYPDFNIDDEQWKFDRSVLKKEIKKKGNKYKKEEIKEIEYKKPWRWQDIDPFFFIPNNAFGGFLILLFLTWLIFGVIFDIGTDLGPPRFFGDDGG